MRRVGVGVWRERAITVVKGSVKSGSQVCAYRVCVLFGEEGRERVVSECVSDRGLMVAWVGCAWMC
jgi:hypothetical protein